MTQRITFIFPCVLSLFFLFLGHDVRADAQERTANFSFRMVLAKNNAQIAIWLNDEKGVFVDTVYVTRKTAQKGMGNRGGGLDDKWGGSRLSALPVWAHQRGVTDGKGNPYPAKGAPLVDAVSSATPKAGAFVWTWRPEKTLNPGKYRYMIEINRSFDDNTDHDYSWYRGQPSVVWQGEIVVGDRKSEGSARIIGHGHVAGADGSITPDTASLTSALKLVDKIMVTYTP